MRSETSEDLLVIISMQKEEPEAAQLAFHEFHRRFKDFVWGIAVTLARSISSPNQDQLAHDIFNDTFRDVFYKYQSESYFDPAKWQDIEKGIKCWLAGIARNHKKRAIQSVSSSSPISYLDTCPEIPFFDADADVDEHEEPEAPDLLLLKRALETVLTSKEREILLISMQFEQDYTLPEDIKRSLCEKYGLVPASLRQVKKRAKEKLEKFFQEHGYFTQSKTKSNVT